MIIHAINEPNAPAEFPIVLKTVDHFAVNTCIDFCYNSFGKPIDIGQPGNWYQNRGYFFFRSRKMAAQLLMAMNGRDRGQPTSTTQSGPRLVGVGSQSLPLAGGTTDSWGPANVLIARVYNAYSVE